MSLRVLRKMQAGKDLEVLSDDVDIAAEEHQIQINRFNLLEDSQSESEVKEDDDLTEVGDGKNGGEDNILCSSPPQNNPTGAKKKRRRKKKKGRCKIPASSEDQMDLEVDEVEMSVREVNAILGEVANQTLTAQTDEKPIRSLLMVEHKHLNPQNEMKRIFGSKVVQLSENNRRRGRGRVGHRGANIVQPQGTWTSLPKPGLSMVVVDALDQSSYLVFKFQHSPIYQQAQFKFLEAVESLNPENIIYLLNQEPKHVDTLVQVSEIFRLADDSAMSARLIEKAIFVMESSTHPLFNITNGNCRLQYKQQENRSFFIALFHHILNVGQKGCYRTALELCKLLLSLSPEDDPLAVSLMIDFYAIRAQEFAWLVALYDSYNPTKCLDMLPNFLFSVPLALYHLSEQDSCCNHKDKTEKNKYIQEEDLGSPEQLRKRADEMLQCALIKFPGALIPLLEKCSIQPDDSVINHYYFGPKIQNSMKKGLQQIVNLFIGRNYHLWKEAGVMTWLEENVNIVIKRVDDGDALVKEYEELRKIKYQGTPTAIYRHILLADIKYATAALPPTLASNPVMSHDPLPPADSMCDYSRPPPKNKESNSSSVLESFFRSILPTYNVNDPDGAIGADAAIDEAGAIGEGAAGELRQSVDTLLEAMRQLLHNINLNEPTGADDADQSEEDPEGEWG